MTHFQFTVMCLYETNTLTRGSSTEKIKTE